MAREESFIMAGDCAVRISDTFKGDCAIVLLHGYLESLDIWEDFTSLLSGQVRVIAVDLPGHGVSEVKGDVHTMAFMADTVSEVLKSRGVSKAILVGHSMGGYVALELLRRHPEAVGGVVLLHSTPNADSEKKREDRQREIEVILGGKKELIAKSFPHVGFAPQNRRRFQNAIEELAEQIVMTEDDGIVAVLRGMKERDDLNEMMRESRVSQMIIFGRHDEYITQDIAESVIAGQPQAQIVWLENSGHMGFIEEPTQCAEAILTFIDSVCGKGL